MPNFGASLDHLGEPEEVLCLVEYTDVDTEGEVGFIELVL